jgi:4-hydroxybutyrate CoA-transferase
MKVHSTADSLMAALPPTGLVYIHGQAATPLALIDAMVRNHRRFRDLKLIHLHTEGSAAYAKPEYSDHFRVLNLFVGSNVRPYVDLDRVDYIPCFLSEMPDLFRSHTLKPDVALISVSPPDAKGYCSLGTSVDATRAAIETAGIIIAQINKQMPRTHGDGFIHRDQIHHAIEVDQALPASSPRTLSVAEQQIGKQVAGLIEDGSTLQMGIGSIPDAVLQNLKGHRHLGIHTEMWSDGALDLIESGAVDNSKKKNHPGKTVATFVMGTKRVYDFVHDNPSIAMLDAAYVNRVEIICRNPKVVAINSAIEVDLSGQVCADSIGSRVISGVGGQIDFIRGANLSRGGKPIIALTARTGKGQSRIVSQLHPGAGVVTTRADVHYVATEYGVVNLHGKSIHERALALISIAHPDDRENLLKSIRRS